MSKDKNIERYIIIGIILITLLEMCFAYKVLKHYRGVYRVTIFSPLLMQPFWYRRLFRKEMSYYKTRVVMISLISVLLPMIIYATLPNYTYDKGKQIVKEHLNESKNIIFVDLAFGKNTILIFNNPKQLFISNRAYYYKIISTEGNKYFMIDPIDGELTQLSESYWGTI